MSKTLRRVVVSFAVILATLIVGVFAGKWIWDRFLYTGYEPGAPLNAGVVSEEVRGGYRRLAFDFDGIPGESVPALLALPVEGDGPWPCAVFLHGIGQQKEFLDEIAAPFCEAGFAIVTFDQYTRGERKLDKAGPLADVLALRRRCSTNVIETRRLLDYLETRPDIASERVYLLGASFGAITGATAMAFEPRLKAGVMCYGGGNLGLIFDSETSRREIGEWHGVFSAVTTFLLAPADPVRHIARVAPRPLLFQNGRNDTVVPAAAGQALYDAAKEPKEMIWYDSDHVGLDAAHVVRVLGDALAWLKKQDGQEVP